VSGRWLAACAATALLVWFNSPELQWPARLWTTGLLAGLPALMIAQARQLKEFATLPRQPAYVSSIASLWVLAGITVLAARAAGMTFHNLGFRAMPALPLLAWAAALTAAGVGVILLFHLAGFRDSALVRELIPVTRSDRQLFLLVSITAGVCEEIVFRGFLLLALHAATGSAALALVLSSGVFGVVHAYQQPTGALRAATIGAIFASAFLWTGSLYPVILAHILVDILSGFWLSKYLLRRE
jgi:uncharacterized protein